MRNIHKVYRIYKKTIPKRDVAPDALIHKDTSDTPIENIVPLAVPDPRPPSPVPTEVDTEVDEKVDTEVDEKVTFEEDRLTELKRLFDKGLLSHEVWEAKQMQILGLA